MYRKEIEGVAKLVTRISHGTDEIGDTLGKLMGNQLCLQLKSSGSSSNAPWMRKPGRPLFPRPSSRLLRSQVRPFSATKAPYSNL